MEILRERQKTHGRADTAHGRSACYWFLLIGEEDSQNGMEEKKTLIRDNIPGKLCSIEMYVEMKLYIKRQIDNLK